ncbi:MAG: helix-turn-helix transcriptional regulator [Paludibacteraceae bacterium]|nr:helix-turn-helix transcriptional regulator [Paludibacteraceae bacterium]
MEKPRNYNRMPSYTTEGQLRVKELLKERGITMQDLAQKIGGNREVISRALSGNPTYSVLANIAAALEVPISELFVTPKPQQHTINGVISCDEQTYIIKDLSDIEAAIEDIKKITSH